MEKNRLRKTVNIKIVYFLNISLNKTVRARGLLSQRILSSVSLINRLPVTFKPLYDS